MLVSAASRADTEAALDKEVASPLPCLSPPSRFTDDGSVSVASSPESVISIDDNQDDDEEHWTVVQPKTRCQSSWCLDPAAAKDAAAGVKKMMAHGPHV